MIETIGDGWLNDFSEVSKLKPYAADASFRKAFRDVKQANKERFAALVKQEAGVDFDTSFLFDVQVKRIHEYKRQLLNLLHVVHLYRRILDGDTAGITPRCALIGGKAAPGYHVAKLIIKLINDVAAKVNAEPKAKDLLRLVFFPNYRVSSMEIMCPGTELSEQVSTAGKEASGTGNMKFMMNGALTVGTLDGANIEIRDNAGAENFFLFGMTAAEVAETKKDYKPNEIISGDKDIAAIMTLLEGGHFNPNAPGIFDLLFSGLRSPQDPWVTIGDLRSYLNAQDRVGKAYTDAESWNEMAVLNTAGSGFFSSDRTIQQYADEIWDVKPLS